MEAAASALPSNNCHEPGCIAETMGISLETKAILWERPTAVHKQVNRNSSNHLQLHNSKSGSDSNFDISK